MIENDILKNLNFNIFKKSFDIIFLDPPYKEQNLGFLLKKVKESMTLSKNAVIIIHRHTNEKDQYRKHFKIIDK